MTWPVGLVTRLVSAHTDFRRISYGCDLAREVLLAAAMKPLLAIATGIGLALGCTGTCSPVKTHGYPWWRECQYNLRAAVTAEVAYSATHGRYSVHPTEIGFTPEYGNRYAYFFAPGGMIADRSDGGTPDSATAIGVDRRKTSTWLTQAVLPPLTMAAGPGPSETCLEEGARRPAATPCAFVVACAGLLSGDELDVWSISTEDRWTPSREFVPAQHPFREHVPEQGARNRL